MAERETGRKRRVKRATREPVTAEPAVAGRGGEKRAPKPQHCRVYARRRLAAALPELTAVLIEQATGGSLGHAKLLLQLSGLDREDAPVPVRKRRGKSLALDLLEDWEARRGAEDADDGAETRGDDARCGE